MKFIKYFLKTQKNTGTVKEPVWEDVRGAECTMPYSEANMAIAESEAYGEIAVVDDGTDLDIAQRTVIAAMSAACREAITGGVDVTLSDGDTYHFSLTTEDQLNLMSLQSMVAAGANTVPYHADGASCRYYSAAELNIITQAATQWKLFQESYFNSLRDYIRSMSTPGELEHVHYGMEIPEPYQTDVLQNLMAQMNGGNTA